MLYKNNRGEVGKFKICVLNKFLRLQIVNSLIFFTLPILDL